jgi:hypothetical protein
MMKKMKLGAYDRLQVPDHSLGGYSHRERWARTRRCFFMNNEAKKAKEVFEIIITTTWREFISIKVK